MPKLLISARDIGAASHLLEVICEAKESELFDVEVVANEPAYTYLKEHGITVSRCKTPPSSAKDSTSLLQEAKQILEHHTPDAILVGLSGLNVGVDEALLHVSPETIPTYAFQDWWGDVNKQLGTLAKTYFVVDELAERLTLERGAERAIVVGAPKYARYKKLNIHHLQQEARNTVSENGEGIFVGFFGQPLIEYSGYLQTIDIFADSLKTLSRPSTVIYLPHPRESSEAQEQVKSAFLHKGVSATIPKFEKIESPLAICDLVVTPFSTCGYDQIMLQSYASAPLGSVIYLLFEPDIREFYYENCGTMEIPPASKGLAAQVDRADKLSSILELSLKKGYQERCWKLSLKLPRPHHSANYVIKQIASDLNL